MKIGSIQSFKAQFSDSDKSYLNLVRQQAMESRRWAEYQYATNTLNTKFPKGTITKVKSYPDVDTFVLNPKAPLELTFRKDEMEKYDNSTSALDAYIKLARMVRRIAQ